MRQVTNHTRAIAVAAALAGILTVLLGPGPAAAKLYAPYTYDGAYPSGSIDGTGSVGGPAPFSDGLMQLGFNQVSDRLLVGHTTEGGRIFQFSAAGTAEPFSFVTPNTAIESGSLNTFGDVNVDNSGEAGGAGEGEQGRIYAFAESQAVKAWKPTGEPYQPAGGVFPISYPAACGAEVAPDGDLWVASWGGVGIQEFDPSTGNPSTDGPAEGHIATPGICSLAIDSNENFYAVDENGPILKYDSAGQLLGTVDPYNGSEAKEIAVDRTNNHLFALYEYVVKEFEPNGALVMTFGQAEGSYPGLSGAQGITVDEANHHVYVANGLGPNPRKVDVFAPVAPLTIPDVTTEGTDVSVHGATLHGVVGPDLAHAGSGVVTCAFKWGISANELTNTAPCDQALPINADTEVTATLGGLTTGSAYFFQLQATNSGNGILSTGTIHSFKPAGPPAIVDASVSEVHSDGALLSGTVDPQGGTTTYEIEYGTTEGYGSSVPSQAAQLPNSLGAQTFAYKVTGLLAGTLYHYRITATNPNDTTHGSDHTFTTFPFTPILKDPCPNAHVRQQVSAALLPDCRAYELVSASDTGGYDVESDLISGQEPFGGYPEAKDRALYGIHSGAIPGPWNPTNRGIDPYIATRGVEGWITDYAGIPADNTYAESPFASDLDEASAGLTTLAFGGPGICSPCFADGSTGIPVRDESGELIQGMAGPANPDPGFESDGLIRKRFSADGVHLIFGSTSLFAAGGNDETGDVSIYDRNLETGQTQVVSNDSSGDPLDCLQGVGQCHSPANTAGIAELDVSSDGSRILVGQLVDTDAAGNEYFHLYMHMGSSAETVDLTPGTTTGALFDGMTEDGSIVYFSTRDPLVTTANQDTDSSIDIFRADLSPSATNLTRVSTGGSGAGNVDSCDPVTNTQNTHWNVVAGDPTDCSAVAVGGGGGVASGSGAIYFLSPEQLDGGGAQDAPNLYVAQPGSGSQFVATLESILTAPDPPNEYHAYTHSFASVPRPDFMAVDASGGPSDGDIYVADNGSQVVRKYDPDGNVITSWADNGVLDGSTTAKGPFGSISGVAVGPDGTLYVGVFEIFNGEDELFEFDEAGSFDTERALEGAIQPVGITVNGDGNVFYVSYGEEVERYNGVTSTQVTTGEFESGHKFGLAVDPNSGDLFVNLGRESLGRYSFDSSGRVLQPNASPCNSNCAPTATFGVAEVSGAGGLAVDPSNGDLYVDEGDTVLRFDSSGQLVPGPNSGTGVLSGSTSLAVGGDGRLYANTKVSGGANVAAFGPLTLAPEARVDNPIVVDAVDDAGTRHTADFQVTPSGGHAAFPSTISLTGYDNGGLSEVFRYDAAGDTVQCASCNPTGARATGSATMAADGLSLTDDGRVFFDTTDDLAPRDLNHRKDAYEWNGATPQLISTGVSPFDSSLLGASADGTDALFFTRDRLVPQDQNGTLAKVYDAREEGGFPFLPDSVPCKASDECHGAGSVAPGPLPIGTITGNGGNSEPARKCRKGFKRRGDRCVKKPKSKQHRNGRRSRR